MDHACLLVYRRSSSAVLLRPERLCVSLAIRQDSGTWRVYGVHGGRIWATESTLLKGERIPLCLTKELAAIAQGWLERAFRGDVEDLPKSLTDAQACLYAAQQAGIFAFGDAESISAEQLRAMALARWEALSL